MEMVFLTWKMDSALKETVEVDVIDKVGNQTIIKLLLV